MSVQRLTFGLLAIFCLVMNALVWRIHYGGGSEPGSQISNATVWKLALESPDTSDLEIRRNGQQIGYARWMPLIKEDENEETLEGMVKEAKGYSLNIDGNYLPPNQTIRHRFLFQSTFDTNMVWAKVSFRLILKPHLIDIEIDKSLQVLTVAYKNGDQEWQSSFAAEELENPKLFLDQSGLGWLYDAVVPWIPTDLRDLGRSDQEIQWTSHLDSIKVGRSTVRGYRTIASAGGYTMEATLNRAGEIFKVSLPGKIELVNDAITTKEKPFLPK